MSTVAMDFPIAQTVKNLPVNQGLILGLRRSSGEGNGNPLQYSCLDNSMDREAWRATVRGSHGLLLDTTERLTHTHTHIHRSVRGK